MQQRAQMQVPVLVIGVAGFIGFHVARRLLADGWKVFGVDDLNDYYDPRLKRHGSRYCRDGSPAGVSTISATASRSN
jgi:UDP-glucuronate 4-epimerase